ncbi:MAG TPA: glycosyltransferase family 2 protein [Anaerolineales bacterium]
MPPKAAPAVSIVVVCWNSASSLPRCLDALSRQTFRDFELILVDNASTDGSTQNLASSYPRLHIRLEREARNMGFAAAANAGAHLAVGLWLALLNPDAFPEPTWLEELVVAAGSYPDCFFASRQIQVNRPDLLDGEGDVYFASGLALRQNYNTPFFPPGPPHEVFSACAAAAMYPRLDFLAAGGFDEDYFAYHEDVDLGFRLRLRGLRCVLIPTAVVHHIGAASTGARSSFAIYHGHRNLVWTYVKDMPSPWFWFYLPLHLVVNIFSLVYFALAGHPLAILRAKLDAVRGLGRAISQRRLVQAQRTVPGSDVVRRMNTHVFGPLEGWISRQWPTAA